METDLRVLQEREHETTMSRADGIERLADDLNICPSFTKADRNRMYAEAALIRATAERQYKF